MDISSHSRRRASRRHSGGGMRKRCGRWAPLALGLALAATLPTALYAHDDLLRSEPADSALLTEAPRALRLTFTGAVELALARLTLTGPEGEVQLGPLSLDPDSSGILIGTVRGALVAGRYTVRWQIAGADGHPVRGELTFVIGPGAAGLRLEPAGPTAPGQEAPPADHHPPSSLPAGSSFDAESPLYAAVRWLTFLGLLGVLGAVAFGVVVLRLAGRREAPFAQVLTRNAAAGAARFGFWMAVVLGLAAVLRLYAQSVALHGATTAFEPPLVATMLTRTVWGWGWVLQGAATVVALTGFALARTTAAAGEAKQEDEEPVGIPVPSGIAVESGASDEALESVNNQAGRTGALGPSEIPNGLTLSPVGSSPERPGGFGWILATLAVLALAFTPGLSGHAVATPGLAPLAVFTDGLHVIGAGGWLGGLLVLIAIGVPVALRLGREHRGPAVAVLVNAFSPTALFFAGVTVASGVFAAWIHVGSVPALWQSAYGRTLLVKIGVLTVVFGTGAYNWLRVRTALGTDAASGRLRRSAVLELAVGAIVLAVTAVLVATPPPAEARTTAMEGVGPAADLWPTVETNH